MRNPYSRERFWKYFLYWVEESSNTEFKWNVSTLLHCFFCCEKCIKKIWGKAENVEVAVSWKNLWRLENCFPTTDSQTQKLVCRQEDILIANWTRKSFYGISQNRLHKTFNKIYPRRCNFRLLLPSTWHPRRSILFYNAFIKSKNVPFNWSFAPKEKHAKKKTFCIQYILFFWETQSPRGTCAHKIYRGWNNEGRISPSSNSI